MAKKVETAKAKTKAPAKAKTKRAPSAWLLHVKATKEANPDIKFKEVLTIAAKSWKKEAK